MRVALMVDSLSPRMTGIGRYTWELAVQLRGMAEVSDLRFYRDGRWFKDPRALIEREVSSVASRGKSIRRWISRRVDQRNRRGRLFHGPNFFLPSFVENGVINVHDLSVLLYPETHPLARINEFEKNFESSLRRAAQIITGTKQVRDEIILHTSVSASNITVINNGVTSEFKPRTAPELKMVLDRYGLVAQGYALCVSTLEPRKKIRELVDAWGRLPQAVRSRWPLVVVGGRGWLSGGIEASLDAGAAQGWVRRLGFVPQSDLAYLYAGAQVFAYPSIYEGFGLPPVEAMACGTPVVVSDRSCLPEVTQGAAMLTNPDDVEALSAALERALVDTEWRRSAVARGLSVAASYRWDRCAHETVEVYRRALDPSWTPANEVEA